MPHWVSENSTILISTQRPEAKNVADERWERVKRLVIAAQELEPEEQAAFLNGLTDPDLREEVESLLAAEGGSFLDKTPPGLDSVAPETMEKSTGISPSRTQTKTPDRIGPYRMLREIGEGGMGVVYEAEQEKPLRSKVARKLIKWGMHPTQVIAMTGPRGPAAWFTPWR